MTLSAEAAKGKKFIVLDRPNLVRADIFEGNVLDPKYRSFVGWYPVSTRYGLTVGELAKYLVGTGQLKADITVVPMQNYRRNMWWNETGLGWVNPSPNIRSGDAAVLYTGTCYFEGTNINEGRGMTQPFQMVGAPYLTDAGAIAKTLNAMKLPGIVFDSTSQPVEKGYKHGGMTVPVVVLVNVAETPPTVRVVVTDEPADEDDVCRTHTVCPLAMVLAVAMNVAPQSIE